MLLFVSDFWQLSDFFFEAPIAYNEKASKKAWKEDTASIMEQVILLIESIEEFYGWKPSGLHKRMDHF